VAGMVEDEPLRQPRHGSGSAKLLANRSQMTDS
jgi:hypothetical protein